MSKFDTFLKDLRDNPERSITVDDIVMKYEVTYTSAYAWARHKYVKEERMGAKPKRVIFNSNKWNADHNGEYVPTGKSVDKAFSKDADSLSGELRAAHKDCIRFTVPTDEQCSQYIKAVKEGQGAINLKEEFEILTLDYSHERRAKLGSKLLAAYRALQYLERENNHGN